MYRNTHLDQRMDGKNKHTCTRTHTYTHLYAQACVTQTKAEGGLDRADTRSAHVPVPVNKQRLVCTTGTA